VGASRDTYDERGLASTGEVICSSAGGVTVQARALGGPEKTSEFPI